MDPLLLFAATVVTDESRAAFAALGQPAARSKASRPARRTSVFATIAKPARRPAAAAA
jgi:hypothetical protein